MRNYQIFTEPPNGATGPLVDLTTICAINSIPNRYIDRYSKSNPSIELITNGGIVAWYYNIRHNYNMESEIDYIIELIKLAKNPPEVIEELLCLQ